MIRKFGQEIDLDEMEETILTRLLLMDKSDQTDGKQQSKSMHVLRVSSTCIFRNSIVNIICFQRQLQEKETELLQLKQSNVEKFNLLTELQEEKNIIEYQLRFQKRLRTKRTADNIQPNMDKDLRRLRAICNQQQQQLKSIDKEIQALRMKAKPLEPVNFVDGMRRVRNFQKENIENIIDDVTAPGSLHSTENASSDASSAQHENEIDEMSKCVAYFLKKHLSIPIAETALNGYAREICAYFVKQFSSYYYQMQQSDHLLRKTIENLRSFIPDAALGHIDATEYVQLYAEIRTFLPNGNDDDASRFSVTELLRSIFDEVVNAIPPKIDDYSIFLLCEFFRETFAVLPLDDPKKIDQLKMFMVTFRNQQRFVVSEIDTGRCIAQLLVHKETFMTHEINENEFYQLITHLIDQIKN